MAYEYDRFDDEETGGGFVLGLIAGAVLGAGIGMLLAPKTGSELRGQLGEAANRWRERAGEGYGKISEMYANRRGAAGSTGSDGSMGAENRGTDSSYQAGGAYAGGTGAFGSQGTPGTAGTSGLSGVDAPATNTEF